MKPTYEIEDVCNVILEGEQTTLERINVKCRDRELVFIRQLCMAMSKRYTRKSLARIGMYIGNRDHATVLHAAKTINNLCDTDKIIREKVADYEKQIMSLVDKNKDYRRIRMIVNIWSLTKYAYRKVLEPKELAAYCRDLRHRHDGYKEIIRTIHYEKHYARIFK